MTEETSQRRAGEPTSFDAGTGETAGTWLVPGLLLRRAFEHWKQAAHAIGVVQTRMIMFLLYVIAVLPMGLVLRLRRDPLHLRPREDGNWTPSQQESTTLERARQQF